MGTIFSSIYYLNIFIQVICSNITYLDKTNCMNFKMISFHKIGVNLYTIYQVRGA